MPSRNVLFISKRQKRRRAEATFLSRTSSPTDEKRSHRVSNDEMRGELIISKDLGPSLTSRLKTRVGPKEPKIQLESLILAQNER